MKSTPAILSSGGRAVPIGSHAGKTIYLAGDHRGFALKERLKRALRARGWRVVDTGTHSARRVDYPVITARAARPVSRSAGRRAVGIGVCGSGIGVAIVAAKLPGVLPACPMSVTAARETRTHNNTNFLCLSSDHMSGPAALRIAEAWLGERFYTDPERDKPYLRRYLQTLKLDQK